MRGHGYNAENSQVSDGRRVSVRKCRDCDNAANGRDLLCTGCKVVAFERRKQLATVRLDSYRQQTLPDAVVAKMSRGLAGLQRGWFTMGAAA